MVINYALLMLILIVHGGNANQSRHLPRGMSVSSEMTPNPIPSGKPVDPAHISDFTDPDTGVNPFLDIPEGRTGAFGRRVPHQDRLIPSADFDLIEGGPDDRRPRGQSPNRWREDSTPKDLGQSVSQQPRETFDFSAFAETESPLFTEKAESPVTYATQPSKFDDVEHVTSKPENLLLVTNVTVTALVTAIGVALLALVTVICYKRSIAARSQIPPQNA